MALTNAEAQFVARHNQRLKDMGGGSVTFTWKIDESGECRISTYSIIIEGNAEKAYKPKEND